MRLNPERGRHLVGAQSGGQSRPSRPEPQRSQNARRNYQQYLTLAQAEARNGNTVAAENYYQYAEHYFRLMTSD